MSSVVGESDFGMIGENWQVAHELPLDLGV